MRINNGLNSTSPEGPLTLGNIVIGKRNASILSPATRDMCNSHFLFSEHCSLLTLMAANKIFPYNRSRQKYLQTLISSFDISQITGAGLGYGWEFSTAEQFRLSCFRLCFADCTFPSDSPFSREYNRPVVTWKNLCLAINHMYSSSSNKMPWTVIISLFLPINFSADLWHLH